MSFTATCENQACPECGAAKPVYCWLAENETIWCGECVHPCRVEETDD